MSSLITTATLLKFTLSLIFLVCVRIEKLQEVELQVNDAKLAREQLANELQSVQHNFTELESHAAESERTATE